MVKKLHTYIKSWHVITYYSKRICNEMNTDFCKFLLWIEKETLRLRDLIKRDFYSNFTL